MLTPVFTTKMTLDTSAKTYGPPLQHHCKERCSWHSLSLNLLHQSHKHPGFICNITHCCMTLATGNQLWRRAHSQRSCHCWREKY